MRQVKERRQAKAKKELGMKKKGSYTTQNKWEPKGKMQGPRDDAKTKGVQKRKLL